MMNHGGLFETSITTNMIAMTPKDNTTNVNPLLGSRIKCFSIDHMPMRIKSEDICFITGLSQRGERVNSIGRTRGQCGRLWTHQLSRNTEKIGTQIPIKHVESLALRILLFSISRVNGSASLHQASHVSMSLVVECLMIVFDWCTSLLVNMKKQLTSIQKGQKKKFGYGTILCFFFFERVPRL